MLTIPQKFAEIVHQYNGKTALAFLHKGEYKKITYLELDKQRQKIAAYWQSVGWQAGQKVAIMLPNSPEWIMADLAAATLGVIVVPIHTTFNQEYIKRVVNHSNSDYLVIHSEYYLKYQSLIDSLDLKRIIVVSGELEYNHERIISWSALVADSKTRPINSVVQEDDVHTIVYTSGTTGDPKGVMLTHKNLLSDVFSAKRSLEIRATDRFFSFLPLSHAFERAGGYYGAIFSGSSIYFAQSMKTIVEDIKLAKPTILPSVPRIFERVYDKIFDNVRSAPVLKRKMFYQAVNLAKLNKRHQLKFWQRPLYDLLNKIVLDKVRHSLGGRLRMAISGGASLNPAIAKFFENLGIKVIEGYGLTETSPIITVNQLDNYKFGTVGKVIDCNEVKISSDKEILVKGDNVMQGYWQNEAATREIIDAEGWLHTGDLGFIDSDGFLTIIGRAKEMIVLSTGKNIFPEPIENILNLNQYITQSMVYGDKQKVLHALLVPDMNELQKWCSDHQVEFSLPAVLSSQKVVDFYRHILETALTDLSEVEKIKEFKLIAEEFSQENGLLTPSLKLRRGKIIEKYL